MSADPATELGSCHAVASWKEVAPPSASAIASGEDLQRPRNGAYTRAMAGPYALVIFDFDGTLADSAPWFGGVLNEVARRYRFREVPDEDRERLRGMEISAICRHLGLPRWKLPFVVRHMRKLATRDIAQIPLFPGVGAMLAGLHGAGTQLAIVSSNTRENVEHVLGVDSASLIDIFACGASTFGKAAKFRKVLKRAGVNAGAVLAVGDEDRDIEAARSVGIDTGAVAWGYAAPAFLAAQAPTLMFDRVEDILPTITGGRLSTSR